MDVMIIIDKFIQAANKYKDSEKVKKNYGTDWLFTSSEMHLIDAVGRNDGISVTNVADFLGVTKGAISQILKKIIERGMVTRTRISMYSKTVSLSLTENGKIVFKAHQDYHKQMYKRMIEAGQKIPKESIKHIVEMFDAYIDLE